MEFAKIDDYDKIYELVKKYIQWFPHIRSDYLKRMIKKYVIFEDGVVIIFNVYKRKNKINNITANKGDVILHQIATTNNDGSASRILNKFFNYVKSDVYLTVRENNKRAIDFYLKNDMIVV